MISGYGMGPGPGSGVFEGSDGEGGTDGREGGRSIVSRSGVAIDGVSGVIFGVGV